MMPLFFLAGMPWWNWLGLAVFGYLIYTYGPKEGD
jgi:hypothetical protein